MIIICSCVSVIQWFIVYFHLYIAHFSQVTYYESSHLQADVYINSTNTNLNLKQGQLSQALLKACGKELQDECETYAPLGPGKVAVTAARNLNCKYIFHVALPDYKTKGSERVSRMQCVFYSTCAGLLNARKQ